MDAQSQSQDGSVALSHEQYLAMKQAIENWQDLKQTLECMQALSR